MNNLFFIIKEMFQKFFYILRGMYRLVREQKLYFFTPILIILALLAFLIYYIGPAVIVSFIYAGV